MRSSSRKIKINKLTLSFIDGDLDMEWTYIQIQSKQIFTALGIALVGLNTLISDMVYFKEYGMILPIAIRTFCVATSCILYGFIYFKNKSLLKVFFK